MDTSKGDAMYCGPLLPLREHELSSGKHIPLVKCRSCGSLRVHTTGSCLQCGSWDAELETDPRHAPPAPNVQAEPQ